MKSLTTKWVLGLALAVTSINPVLAQSNPELTQAEVYKFERFVDLLLANKPVRQVRLKDALRPLDALQTKARSRAELLFNEGSFLRIGASTPFRFKPGLRRIQLKNGRVVAETIFELQNGTVVAVTPVGSSGTTVEIPGAGKVESLVATLPTPPGGEETSEKLTSAVFSATYDSTKKVASIANIGTGEIRVFNSSGNQSRVLKGGETIDIRNGVLGDVKVFDLNRFHATTKLGAGLGPGQEALLLKESPEVQEIFRVVRKDTIAAWKAQRQWIEGLCTLNGRGGASTLSSNCINTNFDDPVRSFEDRRDVGISDQRDTPPIIELPQPQPQPQPNPIPQ